MKKALNLLLRGEMAKVRQTLDSWKQSQLNIPSRRWLNYKEQYENIIFVPSMHR